jgi:hypothetical protein
MRKKKLEKIKTDFLVQGFHEGVASARKEMGVEKEMFKKLFNENMVLREKIAKRVAAGAVEIRD